MPKRMEGLAFFTDPHFISVTFEPFASRFSILPILVLEIGKESRMSFSPLFLDKGNKTHRNHRIMKRNFMDTGISFDVFVLRVFVDIDNPYVSILIDVIEVEA
jgi:hypothetical protein